MEKVLWVVSGEKKSDGLEVVNEYLEKGWTVKHISASHLGDSMVGQAYIVIEKAD